MAAAPSIAPLLAEFEQEQKTTRRVLERVPDGRLDWKPNPKGMSLGQLAFHIAACPEQVSAMLKSDAVDVLKTDFNSPQPRNTAEILAAFDKGHQAAAANLSAMSDGFLQSNWTVSKGPQVMMSMPRLAAVRMIMLNHVYHHRGQLTTYFRCLGVPVPSVYGPSADENPFG